jgi:DNA-directed RNA polymerase, mitochondrial
MRQLHATVGILSGTDYPRQIEIENAAVNDGIVRYREMVRDAVERKELSGVAAVQRLYRAWLDDIIHAVRAKQETLASGKMVASGSEIGTLICDVDAERIAVACLNAIMTELLSNPDGVSRTTLCFDLARAVAAESGMDTLNASPEGKERLRKLMRRWKSLKPPRVMVELRKFKPDAVFHQFVMGRAGSWLLAMMSQCCTIPLKDDQVADAFDMVLRNRRGRHQTYFVRLSAAAEAAIEDGHMVRQFLRPAYPFMLVRPLRYCDDSHAPYVTINAPLIARGRWSQLEKCRKQDMEPAYKALDALGSVPWKINLNILAVQDALMKEGGGTAVPLSDPRPYPPKPAGFDGSKRGQKAWEGVDRDEQKRWKIAASEVHRHNIETKGARFAFIRALETAAKWMVEERFYMPNHFEFRGRMQPIPRYLNHHQGDTARSLLLFADPVDHGQDGLYWLAVHTANMFGHDKMTFTEQVQWVADNMDNIRQSARDPLGYRWWTTGDEKTRLQFLAACMGMDEPDGMGRHIPCQSDGTCNGTQHYAAMALDPNLAELVAMTPSGRPGAYYTHVAEIVKAKIAILADRGNSRAAWILPHVTRKLCKRPVMTDGYNVTKYGATDQIIEELRQSGVIAKRVDAETWKIVREASRLLAVTILDTLSELSPTVTAIKEWIGNAAREVCLAGKCVQWQSPTGFPVEQHYRTGGSDFISTVLGKMYVVRPDDDSKPDVRKQAAAAAPNFNHCMDAAHCQMTVVDCHAENISMATVHDSFWTHAGTMARMNTINREAFVRLHTPYQLEILAQQLRTLAPAANIPAPPARGAFDITQVLKAPRFFS